MSYNGINDWGTVQTDWTRVDEETKRELRISGLAAYKVTEEKLPLREVDTIVAYVHPEADIDIPEGNRNTLSLVSSGDRPPASSYQDEFGDAVRVVPPDVFYSDLMEGNERYFRKELIENEDFRRNVLGGVSDGFYTEIVDQYAELFDRPEELERF